MIFHSLCLFCVGEAATPWEGHLRPTSALTNETPSCLNATVLAASPRLLGGPGHRELRAMASPQDPAKAHAPLHTDAVMVK